MSRRAKLLLTACFLVPLLLLGTYTALTWRPHDPLRFHAVVVDGDHHAPPGWRKLEYVVENTSYAPIHLVEFSQGPQDDPLLLGGHLDTLWVPPSTGDIRKHPGYIPARSTVRTWRIIRERDLHKDKGHYWMQYLWVSHTRERFHHYIYWIRSHSPPWLRSYIPRLTLHYDSTPITVPPGT